MEPINWKRFEHDHHTLMLHGVPYLWGGKVAGTTKLEHVMGLDCSGYSQLMIYRATAGKVKLPSGSLQQHEFVSDKLEQIHGYESDYSPTNTNTRLYICFINPTEEHAGHVWFKYQDETFECYGGNGVGTRTWNHRPLPQEVSAVYLWPHIWE